MEEKPPSNESELPELATIELPSGDGPQPHPFRFLDPRIVEAHFAPLLTNRPSPEERWAQKANATPFPGL